MVISFLSIVFSIFSDAVRAKFQGDSEPLPLASGEIRVYSNRFCPFAERVLIYLSAKGVSAEVVNIHLQNKPEWFSEKNAIGKVPAVEIDGEVTVESGLIPEYLDDRLLSSKRILPTAPFAKYQQKLLVDKLSSVAMSFYGLMQFWKNAEVKDEKFSAVLKAMANAESLLTNDFYGGETPGYADYMSLPFFIRHAIASELGEAPLDSFQFPGNDYPKLTKWYKQMMERDEVIAAIQPHETAKKFLEGFIRGHHDYDIGI